MADEHLKYLTGRFTLDTSDLDRAKKSVGGVKDELNSIGKDAGGSSSPESRFDRIRKAAEDVAKVGDKLTVGVTLPVVALGAAATSAANEFNTTFTRMENLAGVAADEVEGLKDSVKGLASETGRGPQELAEALYFIRSAGLDGATAVEALDASAKAAAIGLGEATGVADALTSAISAYGEGNLTAADAVNVLIRTAREGKAEAAELAPQFGRLLPVASNLGISFDQVGAGLAFLTRASGDASLASTQLGGVMNALLKPSAEAKNLLEGVGLSSAGIRKQLRDEGLLATLQTLNERFNGNSEALGTVFADVQGLQGALQLLQGGGTDAAAVFGALKSTTDELGTAFSKFADTDAAKQQRAVSEAKVALIEFGESAAPVATKLATFAGGVARAFDALPSGLQTATVAVGLLAAAMGPLLSVGGRLIDTYDTVRTGLSSLGAAFRKSATDATTSAASTAASSAALGPAGIAIAGVTAAVGIAAVVYDGWRQRKEELKRSTETLAAALADETKSVNDSVRANVEADIARRNQTDDLARAGVTYELLTAATLGSAEAQRELRRRLVESGEVELRLDGSHQSRTLNLAELTQAYIDNGQVADGLKASNEGLLDTLDTLGRSLEDQARKTLDQAVAAGKLSTAQADAALGTLKLLDGTTDYAAVLDFARAALVEQAAATDEVTAAQVAGQPATEAAILGAKEQKALADEVREAEERKAKALRDSYAAVLEGANEQIAYERAQIRTADALGKVETATAEVAKGGKDLEKNQRELELALLDARDGLISQAQAAAEADANQRGLKSASDDAAGSLAVQVAELSRVRDSLAPDSPLRAYLDEYIAKLQNEIPRQIATDVLIRAGFREDEFSVGAGSGGPVRLVRKMGGPVPGVRDEPVPALLHAGEYVLSADVVDAIKRGDPTIGLGQRIAGGADGAVAPAGAVVHNHLHISPHVVGSPVMIDEAELGRILDRMVILHG